MYVRIAHMDIFITAGQGRNGDCNWRHKRENDITVLRAAQIFCLLNRRMCACISVH